MHEADPLRVAATGLAQLGAQHPEDYAVPEVYQGPTGLPILFLHRTASGDAFYFDAPYLH